MPDIAKEKECEYCDDPGRYGLTEAMLGWHYEVVRYRCAAIIRIRCRKER
jgi:hypothetical protein